MAALFCGACLLFTWGGVLLLRPWVRRWLGPEPGINDFASYFLSAYGVFYGLVLGLIAVATYQNFSNVETTVSKEATSIATLYRDMSAYPDPVRGRLQKHMQDYVNFLINEAWPAQQQGQIHPGGSARVTALHHDLLAFEPTSRRDEIVHAETLRQFNVFLEARYQRLQSVTTALSSVLWWVVCIGAALNFSLLWFFSLDKLSAHLALSGILALFVGLMLFFIAAMDNPFRGEESVSPDAYKLVRQRLMNESG
ncbi:DUF4239 domain-containing protein [Polaromonas sp. A23]|uniref:bestrophin-like domain n=1 Tax=Polaromonas sp. A23 TaxID=1944133 RepID=UPI0009869747|nr:DUF4239 domain-containing protein [Polaromonas sp. A23]OOG37920.1 hypothetical protein B0B52_17590 [Polaromonas sp. A23]